MRAQLGVNSVTSVVAADSISLQMLSWLRRHFSRGQAGNLVEVAWPDEEWRDLRPEERELIERLLAAQPFSGRDDLLAQLPGSRAKTIDADGSISIQVTSPIRADIPVRVPVTGHTTDADGMWMEMLIHVVDGALDELELWRGDLAAVQRYPRASGVGDFFVDPKLLPKFPKSVLYELIETFSSRQLDTEHFCAQFETAFHSRADSIQWSPAETAAFGDVFEAAAWFSSVNPDRTEPMGNTNEQQLRKAVNAAQARLARGN